MADRDTHRGTCNRGMVKADCGICFVPRPVAFGRTALPGDPADPDQICPDCQRQNVTESRPRSESPSGADALRVE